ncbi:MAG: hypothetical protein EAZ42_02370 [Verrucomicrobia bacterium]|nr:MAG: hypothetical protein EAZ42_02370 [Verrucomicrobiota bacterium]
MNFRISDTFTSSLAKLTAQEQKTVKTTVFDLQINPSHSSLSFHRIDRAKDSQNRAAVSHGSSAVPRHRLS